MYAIYPIYAFYSAYSLYVIDDGCYAYIAPFHGALEDCVSSALVGAVANRTPLTLPAGPLLRTGLRV